MSEGGHAEWCGKHKVVVQQKSDQELADEVCARLSMYIQGGRHDPALWAKEIAPALAAWRDRRREHRCQDASAYEAHC